VRFHDRLAAEDVVDARGVRHHERHPDDRDKQADLERVVGCGGVVDGKALGRMPGRLPGGDGGRL
jgi:hypothetical protein